MLGFFGPQHIADAADTQAHKEAGEKYDVLQIPRGERLFKGLRAQRTVVSEMTGLERVELVDMDEALQNVERHPSVVFFAKSRQHALEYARSYASASGYKRAYRAMFRTTRPLRLYVLDMRGVEELRRAGLAAAVDELFETRRSLLRKSRRDTDYGAFRDLCVLAHELQVDGFYGIPTVFLRRDGSTRYTFQPEVVLCRATGSVRAELGEVVAAPVDEAFALARKRARQDDAPLAKRRGLPDGPHF
jgi:hypothetical protein